MLTITLREARLILERLVQAAGAPPGMLMATRDAAVAAALSGPDGFEKMPGWIEALVASAPRPLDVLDSDAVLTVDCGGQHAFYCAEALLALAIDADRRGGGSVLATGIGALDALAGLPVLAERYGMSAALAPVNGGIAIVLQPRPAAEPTVLDRIRLDGWPVHAPLWWQLYDRALDALAPDSFESRRHAGTVRVEADGRLIGRNDEDETDLSMLTTDTSAIRIDGVPSTTGIRQC